MTARQYLVQTTLAEVESLRTSDFKGSDELVLLLLESYPPEQSLADLLWSDLPHEANVQTIADLLSLWSWRTNDNGSQIMRTVERWIDECIDPKQIAVALYLDAYPFISCETRVAKLQKVALKFPELASRCDAIINQTRQWVEGNTACFPSDRPLR